MTDDHGPAESNRLGLEPDDLDGYTIDELTDYLESGRDPLDPSIEASAGCQLALDALERLHGLGGELIDSDAAASPEVDENWVGRILGGIALDARAGRRIPFAEAEPTLDLAITEGAVRGVIRSAENAVPGLLVGRCMLEGDLTVVGAPIDVVLEVSAVYGTPIPQAVARLRAEVVERVGRHTDLVISTVDITVRDIRRIEKWTEEER